MPGDGSTHQERLSLIQKSNEFFQEIHFVRSSLCGNAFLGLKHIYYIMVFVSRIIWLHFQSYDRLDSWKTNHSSILKILEKHNKNALNLLEIKGNPQGLSSRSWKPQWRAAFDTLAILWALVNSDPMSLKGEMDKTMDQTRSSINIETL